MAPFEELEQKFGEFLGVPNVVACSSGTAALHLAFEALQLPQGSKVLVPDLCMVACARAVVLAGLEPVFVDCDPTTGLFDIPSLYDAKHYSKAPHVLVVHLYGRQEDTLETLTVSLLDPVGCHVEDLAELHGIKPDRGTDAACWSFYRNKTIGGEEGGAVAFPQSPSFQGKKRAELARSLRSLGFTEAHDFWHNPCGHNYRMANLLAKPILESLASFPVTREVLRNLERSYDEACPPEWRMPPRQAPWVYDFRVPGMTPDVQERVVRRLQGVGVPARHCFKPMTSLPEFRGCKRYGGDNALGLSREVVYVPFSLQPPYPDQVFDTVKSCL